MGNTQSKTFWSFLILVDVLLLVAFGWALADRLYAILEEPVVSVQPARLPKARPAKKPTAEMLSEALKPAGPPSPPEPAAPKIELAKAEPKAEPKAPKAAPKAPARSSEEEELGRLAGVRARKVVFTYRNARAKKVAIEGTFTRWKSQAMQKKDGEWSYTTYLLPGADYPYRFIVDGKMIADPANPKQKWGKSLMPVR